MPKEKKTRIEGMTGREKRFVETPLSDPELTKVVANPQNAALDARRSYMLDGMVKGLQEINPKINAVMDRIRVRDDLEDERLGADMGMTGQDLEESASDKKRNAYFGAKGSVDAANHVAERRERYRLRDQSVPAGEYWADEIRRENDAMDGMNLDYRKAFHATSTPEFRKLQDVSRDYEIAKVTDDAKAVVSETLANHLDSEWALGNKVKEEDIREIIRTLPKSMGMSQEDRADLLVQSIQQRATEGKAFELIAFTKLDNPDGSKGAYWNKNTASAIRVAERTSINARIASQTKEDKDAKEFTEKKQDAALSEATKLTGPNAIAYIKNDPAFKGDIEAQNKAVLQIQAYNKPYTVNTDLADKAFEADLYERLSTGGPATKAEILSMNADRPTKDAYLKMYDDMVNEPKEKREEKAKEKSTRVANITYKYELDAMTDRYTPTMTSPFSSRRPSSSGKFKQLKTAYDIANEENLMWVKNRMLFETRNKPEDEWHQIFAGIRKEADVRKKEIADNLSIEVIKQNEVEVAKIAAYEPHILFKDKASWEAYKRGRFSKKKGEYNPNLVVMGSGRYSMHQEYFAAKAVPKEAEVK